MFSVLGTPGITIRFGIRVLYGNGVWEMAGCVLGGRGGAAVGFCMSPGRPTPPTTLAARQQKKEAKNCVVGGGHAESFREVRRPHTIFPR